MMMVKHIENGTVIDHIAAGKGLDVLHILGGLNGATTVVAANVSSSSIGMKDILKLENTYVDKSHMDLISIISPNATINVIKNSEVVEKYRVGLPEVVEGVLKCLNPQCITNQEREPLSTRFSVSTDPVRLTCLYCGKEFDERLASTL